MATPLLSIIIVSYNTRDVLRSCLASIEKDADLPTEVIVVDNASPDRSAQMVAGEFPAVRLVRSTENHGFSPANNHAAAMARGTYVLLLNPDTVVGPGSLRAWVEAHEQVGATISGPRLLNTDGSLQVSAWRVPGLLDAFLELFLLHGLLGRKTYPAARLHAPFRPGFVSGAAMLCGRAVYQQAGGLDPAMFWMEDADLCLRITNNGGSCWYLPGPGIVHIGGESSRSNVDRMIANQLLSRIKFTRKHGHPAAALLMACVIGLHAVTRTIAFGVVAIFRKEARAAAYRRSLGRLYRYLWKGDRSI